MTDHAAIDLDLHVIMQQLALGTRTSYTLAERLYKEGAHSQPVARITLDEPLSQYVPVGTVSQGVALKVTEGMDAQHVLGTVLRPANIGDTKMIIAYQVNQFQDSYVGCQVGANPSPLTDGCFASSGTMNFPDLSVDAEVQYSYNVSIDNLNNLTIRSFSTKAQEMMADCDTCPLPDFEKFHSYYGKGMSDKPYLPFLQMSGVVSPLVICLCLPLILIHAADYGNTIVMSALYGHQLDLQNVQMDFGKYSTKGRVGK